MKIKSFFFSAALLGLAFTSCSAGLSSKSTDVDSVSYAFGINIGESLKKSKIDGLTPAIIAAGISDVLEKEGANAKMTYDESIEILQSYFTKMQTQTLEKNTAAGREFLENNKSAEGVITLESGLQYKVVTAGTGAKPTAEDEVKVHYRGTLLNGDEFDSSYERGEPITFRLDRVIKGWTEGLQQIPAGSKVILYVPSNLAYGSQGSGSIEPNSTLIFEIELLEVIPAKK
ncbi:peptidyl-prolyl cis-trans isomerase [Bacteroidia bacterium]|nr:peptidyl-prolyl cis-trans isomerase [Bacteroidia bacterium]